LLFEGTTPLGVDNALCRSGDRRFNLWCDCQNAFGAWLI
jgi:hypothetical protein